MDYIKSKMPAYPEDPSYDPLGGINGFLESPSQITPFLYDSIIALGLAACNVTRPDTYFTGREHYDRTMQTTFEGASGKIVLNPKTGTRNAMSALFTVTNFIEDDSDGTADNIRFTTTVTDFFKDGEWFNLEPYTFNDGSRVPPLDIPEQKVDNNYIPSGLRAFGMAMGALVMFASVGFACWTQIHSHERVVKASQPIFLHIICSGTMLMGASIIPLTIDDGFVSTRGCEIACHTFPWLLLNGFVIAMSALFTKTRRINIIFHQPSFKRITVTPLDVMKPMFALVGGESLSVVIVMSTLQLVLSLSLSH